MLRQAIIDAAFVGASNWYGYVKKEKRKKKKDGVYLF